MSNLAEQIPEIDQAQMGKLRDAETAGGGVQLPFPVAYIHWQNGDPKAKAHAKDNPALYFGGWATDNDKLGQLVEDGVVAGYPEGWSAFEGHGENAWNGMATRAITFSFISTRERWLGADGVSYTAEYDPEHTRRHLQTLALLYSAAKPWGYTVLTAKGFQAKYFREAVAAWSKAIAPHRKAIGAATLPLSAFAIRVGTAGEKPEAVAVGRTATKSITPIRPIIPDDLTAEAIEKRFIGATNLRANIERLEMAGEWMAAWKETTRARSGGASEEPPAEDPNW